MEAEHTQATKELSHAYVEALIMTLFAATELNDLTFFKTTLTTPTGGVYLLSLLHVDGPKINRADFEEKEGQ